ncbi:SO2930 family diheme c-type cytochrome [Maricaulis sp. CAU 1757]
MTRTACLALIATTLLVACDAPASPAAAPHSGTTSPAPIAGTPTFIAEGRPQSLGDWGMLRLEGDRLRPADGVMPYDLNAALFSDYAHKLRTLWIPPGEQIGWREGAVLDLPVGTVITKTFWYPETAGGDLVLDLDAGSGASHNGLDLTRARLIETRVLVHRESGWDALPYIWNEAQTEATLQRAGALLRLTGTTAANATLDFAYAVPNANQCAGCHATDNTTRAIQPIGPAARHLNRHEPHGDRNQLAALVEAGWLDRWPGPEATLASANDRDPAEPLEARARAYLDINCAHCHNPVGPADTSGLHLGPETPHGAQLGFCKLPIAAGGGTGGRRYAIAPGQPDHSILLYRMETNDPGAMMPELGRAVRDEAGIALIRDWIASLGGDCGG